MAARVTHRRHGGPAVRQSAAARAKTDRRSRRPNRHRRAHDQPKSRYPGPVGADRSPKRCAGRPPHAPGRARMEQPGHLVARRTRRKRRRSRRCGHPRLQGQLNALAMTASCLRGNAPVAVIRPRNCRPGHGVERLRKWSPGHAPVWVERLRDCGRGRAGDCGYGRQSDDADAITDHKILLPRFCADPADLHVSKRFGRKGVPSSLCDEPLAAALLRGAQPADLYSRHCWCAPTR